MLLRRDVRRWFFVTRRVEVPIRGLDARLDGYRIVHLSDLHIGALTPSWWGKRWIARANAEKPDAVAVTGDLVTSGVAFHEEIADLIGGLHAKDGVFCAMGNHDYFGEGEPLISLIRERGPKVLRNEGVVVERDGARLYITAIDDTWTRRADVDLALAEQPANVATVMLAHDPDKFPQIAKRGVDLVLSGHTHGGQIAVPFLARWINASKLAHHFHIGVYKDGDSTLYVPSGPRHDGAADPPRGRARSGGADPSRCLIRCYDSSVEIVAIVALGRSVEEEAPRLAADLGLTTYETAVMLRAPAPVIVLRSEDRARTLDVLGKLRSRGHDAVACELDAVVSSDDMFRPRAFRFDAGDFVGIGHGEERRLPLADVFALIRANHVTRTEDTVVDRQRKISLGRGALTGGLLMTKTTTTESRRVTSERELRPLRVPQRRAAVAARIDGAAVRRARRGHEDLEDAELRGAHRDPADARALRRVRRAPPRRPREHDGRRSEPDAPRDLLGRCARRPRSRRRDLARPSRPPLSLSALFVEPVVRRCRRSSAAGAPIGVEVRPAEALAGVAVLRWRRACLERRATNSRRGSLPSSTCRLRMTILHGARAGAVTPSCNARGANATCGSGLATSGEASAESDHGDASPRRTARHGLVRL